MARGKDKQQRKRRTQTAAEKEQKRQKKIQEKEQANAKNPKAWKAMPARSLGVPNVPAQAEEGHGGNLEADSQLRLRWKLNQATQGALRGMSEKAKLDMLNQEQMPVELKGMNDNVAAIELEAARDSETTLPSSPVRRLLSDVAAQERASLSFPLARMPQMPSSLSMQGYLQPSQRASHFGGTESIGGLPLSAPLCLPVLPKQARRGRTCATCRSQLCPGKSQRANCPLLVCGICKQKCPAITRKGP